jgi:hypothetical protein
MATLTLLTIRNLVRSNLNDSSVLSNSELNSIINDGYKDATVKAGGYENKIAKTNIPTIRMIPLISNSAVKVNYIEYKIGATEGGKGMIKILPQVVGSVPTSSAFPTYWFQWGDFIVLEQPPDVATYDLAVYASCYPAAVLSADGDLLASLPAELHECVYLFALAFAALKLKRWADAGDAYNKYISSIQINRAEYIIKQPDARALQTIPDDVVEVKSERT